MEMRPKGYEKVMRLLDKGVEISNPLSLDIGPDVDVDCISGDGVVLYPGCRIYGAQTVISAGVRLGAEAPVTIDNCQLGPSVALKGGYFMKSVFLEKANMGSGAQVREGTLLEEEANGAHCVGLKQTILFPFVTLGSLINFCDCFMSGGTSRKNHGEVGSSYIHFNFTPDGNKTTASLFGDVPRGVMLNQPPIFLGGQGGTVGPVRTGYGTVVAAGSVLRDDVPGDNMFVMGKALPGVQRAIAPQAYKRLSRIVEKNIVYLASLVALEQWYVHVRRPFFAAQDLGLLVYDGALRVLASARAERAKGWPRWSPPCCPRPCCPRTTVEENCATTSRRYWRSSKQPNSLPERNFSQPWGLRSDRQRSTMSALSRIYPQRSPPQGHNGSNVH